MPKEIWCSISNRQTFGSHINFCSPLYIDFSIREKGQTCTILNSIPQNHQKYLYHTLLPYCCFRKPTMNSQIKIFFGLYVNATINIDFSWTSHCRQAHKEIQLYNNYIHISCRWYLRHATEELFVKSLFMSLAGRSWIREAFVTRCCERGTGSMLRILAPQHYENLIPSENSES